MALPGKDNRIFGVSGPNWVRFGKNGQSKGLG